MLKNQFFVFHIVRRKISIRRRSISLIPCTDLKPYRPDHLVRLYRTAHSTWCDVLKCELQVGSIMYLKRELRIGFCELRVAFCELRVFASWSKKIKTATRKNQLALLFCNSHFWFATRTSDDQLAISMFKSHFWCTTCTYDVRFPFKMFYAWANLSC